LTAFLGSILLVLISVVIVTGLLSYVAYSPRLAGNDIFGGAGPLGVFAFEWPTTPSWLYAVTQGLHVTVGVVTAPVLLAKLWSVIPKLFEWPPARSPAHALERLTLALLVGGVLFEFATGILNIQLFYPWGFSFARAHFYGAWVFIAAFVLHVVLKFPLMLRQFRERGVLEPLRRETLERSEPASGPAEAAATLSRRGLLGLVGASSAGLLVLTAGQSLGGPFRRLALLAPHDRSPGRGPNGFQINKTAASVGISEQALRNWSLEVRGAEQVTLTREQLLALPQHTERLPIACVEGWSTTQAWTGVRIADLARMAGMRGPARVLSESVQKSGGFRSAALSAGAVADERSLLALKVNGADLSLDHGFPARVIVPALPGVHCTKWVRRMTFSPA